MPRGNEHDLIYTLSIYAHFSIVMGKKDRCAVFGCNNDCLFPRNIQ